MRLEYETRDGRSHADEVPLSDLAETARRMYKERSRAAATPRNQQAWRH
jgi:hypothetical protein